MYVCACVCVCVCARNRKQWLQLYLQFVDNDEQDYLRAAQMLTVEYAICQGDKACYKCTAEQQLSIEEQSGAV